MKRKLSLLPLLIFSLLMVSCKTLNFETYGQKKKREKTELAKKEEIKKPAKKETAYEKLFKGKSPQTVKSSFITIHKIGSEIYFELPLKYLDKEMLLSSTPKATSNPSTVTVGLKSGNPELVKFQMADSSVVLVKCPVYNTFDDKILQSRETNFINSRIGKYKLEAMSPDSSAVVFKATTLFGDKGPFPAPISGNYGSYKLAASAKNELMTFGEIKSFEDNISVVTEEVYSVSASQGVMRMDLGNVSVNIQKGILLLPADKMKPRLSDPRLSIFLTGKQNISPNEGSSYFSFINRWRVEPSDTAAWERGELVEPTKPIVFYLDSAFPEDWKPAIRKGTLRWNKAFEKIGFKNVVQVRDFPENDSTFDPDNLKYSCIRYSPATVQNAMGPSWVDPTTGEIINASVIVYNDIVKVINKWRYVQTAQIDESVRDYPTMPKNIFDESMEYVVAHEVGHTLGFMHNMSASAAYPVDSLRSATFTQKYGTTPSIMDYARFNYVAQPGDNGVRLLPPELGIYDYYTVKWAYAPIKGNKSVKEEYEVTKKWADEKAGDPLYRYGRQQLRMNYDPTALMEDLGDNPIKASNYGVKNLKYILSNLDKWINDDDFSEKKVEIYQDVVNQYFRYLTNVMYQIGGTKLTTVREGTKGKRLEPLPFNVQRESMKWLINEMRNSEWLSEKDFTKDLFNVKASSIVPYAMMGPLLNLTEKIAITSHKAEKNTYSMRDFYDDLYQGVFQSTIAGEKLNLSERMLQRYLVVVLTKEVNPWVNLAPGAGNAFTATSNLSVEEQINMGLYKSGFMRANRAHFESFDSENGSRSIADNLLKELVNAGAEPHGFQPRVPVNQVDESYAYSVSLLKKTEKLLKARISSANPEDKAHYDLLLVTISGLLSK